MTTTMTMTKNEVQEKIGKKWMFSDQQTLAAKLDYINGIKTFDEILDGKPLSEIDAVIHLEKYPKGLLFKIAKGFGGFTTFPFPISSDEIKKVTLTDKLEKSKQIVTDTSTQPANTKKHGFPALLSFLVPGLGQLIKGHFMKAIIIWASAIFIWFAIFGSLMSGQLGLSILLYFIPFVVWLWNVYDAYNSNTSLSNNEGKTENISHLIFELKDGAKINFGVKQNNINEVKDYLKEIKLTYSN